MPSCNTYHLTWVFLPWAWGISSRLLQQSTAAAPYLGRGVSPYRCVPNLQPGIAPLGPPAPAQPPLLGMLLPAAGPGLVAALFSIALRQTHVPLLDLFYLLTDTLSWVRDEESSGHHMGDLERNRMTPPL